MSVEAPNPVFVNFLSFKTDHPRLLSDFDAACKRLTEEKRQKKCADDPLVTSSQTPDVQLLTPRARQADIRSSFEVSRSVRKVSKEVVTNAVVEYVVQAVKPISEVESEPFCKLISTIAQSEENLVPSRYIVTDRLEKKFEEAKTRLKTLLKEVDHVCTTADGWSSRRRFFLGATVHWLDPVTLARKSACLGLRRIKGSHTHDVLAASLAQIHSDFGLSVEKITCTVTDNGSNFVKAFEVFGKVDTALQTPRTPNALFPPARASKASFNVAALDGNYSDEEDELGDDRVEDMGDDEDQPTPVPLTQLLDRAQRENEEYPDSLPQLPPQVRCADHTLNLASKKDVIDILNRKGEKKSFSTSSELLDVVLMRQFKRMIKYELKLENETLGTKPKVYELKTMSFL